MLAPGPQELCERPAQELRKALWGPLGLQAPVQGPLEPQAPLQGPLELLGPQTLRALELVV